MQQCFIHVQEKQFTTTGDLGKANFVFGWPFEIRLYLNQSHLYKGVDVLKH